MLKPQISLLVNSFSTELHSDEPYSTIQQTVDTDDIAGGVSGNQNSLRPCRRWTIGIKQAVVILNCYLLR